MKSSRLALYFVVLSTLLGLNGAPALADDSTAGDATSSDASSSAGSSDAGASDTPVSSDTPGSAAGEPGSSADATTSSGDASAAAEATQKRIKSFKEDAKLDARAALVTMTPFNSGNGISFQYPKSWNIEVPTEGPTFFRAKTMKGIVNFNAIVDQMPAGMTLADYIKMTVEMTPKALAEQKMQVGPFETVEQKSIDIGKLSGTKLVINYEFKDIKLKVKTTQVFALAKNGSLYILCFSMPEDTYDEYTSLIQQMLDSVKFS